MASRRIAAARHHVPKPETRRLTARKPVVRDDHHVILDLGALSEGDHGVLVVSGL
jgi:hypothetical protein